MNSQVQELNYFVDQTPYFWIIKILTREHFELCSQLQNLVTNEKYLLSIYNRIFYWYFDTYIFVYFKYYWKKRGKNTQLDLGLGQSPIPMAPSRGAPPAPSLQRHRAVWGGWCRRPPPQPPNTRLCQTPRHSTPAGRPPAGRQVHPRHQGLQHLLLLRGIDGGGEEKFIYFITLL